MCGKSSPKDRTFPHNEENQLPNECIKCRTAITTRRAKRLRPKPKKLKIWTNEDHDIIRRDHQHTRQSKEYLAQKLDTTYDAVQAQVRMLGLTKTQDKKPWTKQEDDQLEQLLANFSINTAAKRMHRSESSIASRAKRLRIPRRNRDNWYTLEEVSQIFGSSPKWVKQKITQGSLKATRHYPTDTNPSHTNPWHITKADLKNYIRRYPQELAGRNIDIIQLVHILAGIADPNPSDRRG